MLVRSQLEYACVTWDPYQITFTERQQDLSKKDYSKYKSVTRIADELSWKKVHNERKYIRLLCYTQNNNEIGNVPTKKC